MSTGHAREKRPGRWELKVYAGRDPLNRAKKIYLYRTVPATGRREAERQLAVFAAEVVSGSPVPDMTFHDLLERWFAVAGPRMVPAGQAQARWIMDNRLRPLHDLKLDVVAGRTGTAILDEFYAALRERGGLCRRREKCSVLPCPHGGGAPLADGSVVRTHNVVRAVFEQARKWGLIDRNPADLAYAGDPDPDEIEPPAPTDVVRLFALAEARDPELVVLLVLASTTGQRRGAVLGLWWDDLDLEAGVATFGHVISLGANGPERVKRGRGRQNRKGRKNVVPLDPAVVAILLAHRIRCAARAELAGVELPADGYVFASDGIGHRPWNPRTVSRHFARLRDDAGLDETRLHDLRHFVVSYLLASGVDLATVKELVGHAAASATTLSVYAHARAENKRAATGILARLLELDSKPPALSPPAEVIPLRPA